VLFVAIESQADHIPNSAARAMCAESWLVRCDNDAKELEHIYGKQVITACERLVERFAPEA